MTPENATLAAGDPAGRSAVARRIVVMGLVIFAVLQPAASMLGRPLDGYRWFEVIGAVVLTGLVCWSLSERNLGSHPVPWLRLAVILALGIALFAVGGANWLATLAVIAAVFGGYSQTPAPALIAAGASGFLLKDAPAADLAAAIRSVAAGQLVVDSSLAAAALAQGDSPLTDRETEVLSAAAGHDAITDIAGRLHLSPGTVRNHLSAAIQKLGARNRAEAAEIAQQKGWL